MRTPKETEQALNNRLAAMIERFWLARGRSLKVEIQEVGKRHEPNHEVSVYGIRSDMLNGYPREAGMSMQPNIWRCQRGAKCRVRCPGCPGSDEHAPDWLLKVLAPDLSDGPVRAEPQTFKPLK